jgi:hypothetical protein
VGVSGGGSSGMVVGDAVGEGEAGAADGAAAGLAAAGGGALVAGGNPPEVRPLAPVSARSWSSVSFTVRCPGATVGVSAEGAGVGVPPWLSGVECWPGVLVGVADGSGAGAAEVDDMPW